VSFFAHSLARRAGKQVNPDLPLALQQVDDFSGKEISDRVIHGTEIPVRICSARQ
jgi:hypothetical protein